MRAAASFAFAHNAAATAVIWSASAPDPCERVSKSAVDRDKKRRALSVAECKALLAAAPEDRRLVYLVLLYTGRSEADQLR